ncbi:uncharacterized protein DUF1460 [Prosthecobacter fusiformis]|uniref:Uncharacterized protein DUF1460 n=1 Tax=Prosthecobacter fusiformis TaxID=48464 RepID=A0A4R7RIJ4_9BACT|nr:N-acetylmuramoyl-L-alanine amidase-like domain-containing protein [Prosthecobacter fusiformis]TDU62553.1 uncharacterized protein DUF1460 [Prosthecobacter fusiformis]
MTRRTLLHTLATCSLPGLLPAGQHLPQNLTFIGEKKFHRLIDRALREDWRSLPIGQRITRAALAMEGTPYVGYTLEIHDHIESPSANFDGQDCWTFFEIALGIARMLAIKKDRYTPADLLHQIEITRYRSGTCHGSYLDRIHYLDEWFTDNQKRGHLKNITASLGPTVPLEGRRIDEMTVLWKSYRYLKHNPDLRPGMAEIEARLQRQPFHYLPKTAVRAIEPRLQNGDIIGIVTHKPHVYCSHVGLAVRSADGVLHFMHASYTHKRVLVDKSLSAYLASFESHAGIVVARPLE